MFDIDVFLNNLLEIKNKSKELKISLNQDQNIFLDFDDLIPFFMFFDKIDEIKEQINLSKKYLFNGFIPLKNYLYSWRMDEYLGGIIKYYEESEDSSILDLIFEQEAFLNKLFTLSYIPGFININNNKISKLSFSRGYQLIEVCLENKIISKETKLNALKTLDNFIFSNKFFKKNSFFLNKYLFFNEKFVGKYLFFPVKLNYFGLSSIYFTDNCLDTLITKALQFIPISYAKIMKDNSNLIFSIIEAYKFTKQIKYKRILKKWIYQGILENFYDKRGFVYSFYKNNTVNKVELNQNFTLIDIFCDYYYFVEEDQKILKVSEKIAEFWLSKILSNNLIPEHLNSNVADLDNQTDFSISLKRVYSLTHNERFLKASEDIFKSIIKNYFDGKYFLLKVDNNSSIIDNSINLKYNALFLKSYIANNYNLDIFDPIFKDR